MTLYEKIQLGFAVATLPVALYFIWLFAKDRWAATWFGRSLMAIAVALALQTLSAILFRIYGPDYWSRPFLLPISAGLAFFAILSRTLVLKNAQMKDKRARAASELSASLEQHRH